MGSKVICPICEQEGYLVFENRKKKPTLESKIGEVIHRNIRHKKYESATRVRHPYVRVIHNVKKDGKWTTIPHYLGKITKIDSNLKHLKRKLNSKISDKVWQAFKKSIDEAKYSKFKDLDSPTNQVIAEIIALRKIPSVKIYDNIQKRNEDDPYHCPHTDCNKTIELVIRRDKINLKALDTTDSP